MIELIKKLGLVSLFVIKLTIPPTPCTANTSQASSYLYFVNFLRSTEKKHRVPPEKKVI